MNFLSHLENVSKMNRELVIIEIKMCLSRWVRGLDRHCHPNYFHGQDYVCNKNITGHWNCVFASFVVFWTGNRVKIGSSPWLPMYSSRSGWERAGAYALGPRTRLVRFPSVQIQTVHVVSLMWVTWESCRLQKDGLCWYPWSPAAFSTLPFVLWWAQQALRL